MTEPEFKQLQQAEKEERQEATAAAAGSSKQKQRNSGQAVVTLNLGREMLEDEFGELCGAVLLQVRVWGVDTTAWHSIAQHSIGCQMYSVCRFQALRPGQCSSPHPWCCEVAHFMAQHTKQSTVQCPIQHSSAHTARATQSKMQVRLHPSWGRQRHQP
jgi:hypothetical protein